MNIINISKIIYFLQKIYIFHKFVILFVYMFLSDLWQPKATTTSLAFLGNT